MTTTGINYIVFSIFHTSLINLEQQLNTQKEEILLTHSTIHKIKEEMSSTQELLDFLMQNTEHELSKLGGMLNHNTKTLQTNIHSQKTELSNLIRYSERSFKQLADNTEEQEDELDDQKKLTTAIEQNLNALSLEGFRTFDNALFKSIFILKNGEGEEALLGTAVLIKEHIAVTNAHNMISNTTVFIDKNGKNYTNITLLKKDDDLDLALLRIENYSGTPLSFLPLSKIKNAIPVFVIGHGFGYTYTVSTGVISAQRVFTRGQKNVTFIQHDAPTNKGNSGGPLINTQGKLIGIHSGGFVDRNFGYGKEGISFAVRVDEVEKFMNS